MDTSFQSLAAIIGFGFALVICLSAAAFNGFKTDLKPLSLTDKVALVIVGLFFLAAFGFVCVNAGHGYVSDKAEPLSQRLSNGHAYWVTAESSDGKDALLTVMDEEKNMDGTHDFITLRIRGTLPPMRFAMIDGKPMALAP